MTGDADGLQAAYVPLEPFRSDSEEQPSVVVLPVPEPYGYRRLANTAIEKSLPDAVGAFIDWLVNESGWKVAERPAANRAVSATKSTSIPLRQAPAGFSKGGSKHQFSGECVSDADCGAGL